MTIQLLRQTPIIRCTECGSPEIVAFCHHCGKPMCAKHGPVKPGLYWFTENREFNGFTLSQWPFNGNQGAHCKECAHSSLNYRRILIYPGILIALICLYILFSKVTTLAGCIGNLPATFPQGLAIFSDGIRDPTIFSGVEAGVCYIPSLIERILGTVNYLTLFSLGVAMVILGSVLVQKRKRVESIGEFGLPVHLGPTTNQIEAIEVLKASFRIDTRSSSSAELQSPVSGIVYPFLRFSQQDILRIHEYREKYRLSKEVDLKYSAGYLVTRFHNNQQLQFSNNGGSSLPKIYPLQGFVKNQAYLSENKGQAESWAVNPLTYSFYPPEDNQEDWNQVPVRIIPLLEEMGSSQQVKLQVQLNTRFFPTLKQYEESNSERIPQVVPEDLILLQKAIVRGDMEYLGKPKTNGIVKELEDKKYFTVEWQNLWVLPQKDVINISLPSMTFKRKFLPETRLTGSLQIRVPALISGIVAVEYVSSLGYPVKDRINASRNLPFMGYSILEIEFDLALNKLPVSTMKVHIKSLSQENKTGEEIGKLYYPGGPTPENVQRFINALSQGPSTYGDPYMYLRSVVQDPKRVSEDPDADNMWYWDVTGRYYYEVTPIDFHIVIYGIEGEAKSNRTYVELSVKSFLCEDGRENSNELHGVLKRAFNTIKSHADAIFGQEA